MHDREAKRVTRGFALLVTGSARHGELCFPSFRLPKIEIELDLLLSEICIQNFPMLPVTFGSFELLAQCSGVLKS